MQEFGLPCLGTAIAQELAQSGAIVIGTATSAAGAATITERLQAFGGRGEILNVNEAFAKAIECGARVIQPPTVVNDNGSKIIKAIISTFGETQHTLIEREGEADFFLPGFEQQANDIGNTKVDLQDIDHLAICIEEGTLDKWSIFYQEAFGFTEIYREEVHNGNSGMNSIVLQNELGNCKFTILEPLPGAQKSQIQNFLDFYQDF